MNATLPVSIPQYLDQLRAALAGADPALVQDALYDAEEYLRAELGENPGKSEAEVIAAVASSYGAPAEVADIYRDTEAKVQTALRPPAPRPRHSALGRFFGVFADPRAYACLFYMLLASATGVFYFVWVVTGLALSAGLSITLIGIPLLVLFFGSVWVMSLVEGRLVEVMLGERMPRRPPYENRDRPLLQRIGSLFTDPRVWSTLFYFVLMLPLGLLYATLAAALVGSSLALIVGPAIGLVSWPGYSLFVDGVDLGPANAWWILPLLALIGVLLLAATLHLVRGIGRLHGAMAKHLLVKAG